MSKYDSRRRNIDLASSGTSDNSTIRSAFIKANKTVGNATYFNFLFIITETHISLSCTLILKKKYIFLWEGQMEADVTLIYRNKDAYFHNC